MTMIQRIFNLSDCFLWIKELKTKHVHREWLCCASRRWRLLPRFRMIPHLRHHLRHQLYRHCSAISFKVCFGVSQLTANLSQNSTFFWFLVFVFVAFRCPLYCAEGDWAEALLLDLEITQHDSWPYRVKPSRFCEFLFFGEFTSMQTTITFLL